MAEHDKKLKPEDVLEIRRLAAAGVPNIVLSNKYNVAKQSICDIKARRSWKNLYADENGKPYFEHVHKPVPRSKERILRCSCGKTWPFPEDV